MMKYIDNSFFQIMNNNNNIYSIPLITKTTLPYYFNYNYKGLFYIILLIIDLFILIHNIYLSIKLKKKIKKNNNYFLRTIIEDEIIFKNNFKEYNLFPSFLWDLNIKEKKKLKINNNKQFLFQPLKKSLIFDEKWY